MPFKKGQSGNPQGRRVECLPEIRNLARQHTKEAIERLVEWMRSKDPKASPFAAKERSIVAGDRLPNTTSMMATSGSTSSLIAR
jgi:hypothetical protein